MKKVYIVLNYLILSVLMILISFILISSLLFHFLDSDSGGEIKRSILFNTNGFDGGPLTTQVIYSLLLHITNTEQTIVIISLLNIVLFVATIIFSVKFCRKISGKITTVQEYILMIMLISIFSFTSLIYYIKPYLLTTFFIVLGLFYFAKYNSNKNNNFLIISSILFSIAILIKNHAYPFIALFFSIFWRKIYEREENKF